MNILTNSQSFENVNGFNILDHLDALNIVKETSTEYHCTCPRCDAGGFKINKTTGQYFGFACDCMGTPDYPDPKGKQAIIDSIAPLDRDHRPSYSRPRQSPKPKPQPIPAINGEVKIAKLPTIPTDRPQKSSRRITYHYSPTQGIDRVESPNPEEAKGYEKVFYQWHIKEGDRTNGKGNQPWPLYRESEAISADGWPLLVEGEECVETLRGNGIAAMTFQGSSWGKEIAKAFNRLKTQCPGLIFIPDQDAPGQKKAEAIKAASADTGFPVIIIAIKSVWPEAPEWADVADIQWGIDMDQADFIRRLELEIHAAVEARNKAPLSKTDEVKLKVKLWLEETDTTAKIIQKSEICSHYRINDRAFDAIAASLDENSSKPKARVYDPDEFMSLPTGGSLLLAPGIPGNGATIIGGVSGAGKTTLAYDLAGSVIMGEDFLGEVPTRQGSVLFVSSDEPHAYAQDKLINRGITHGYKIMLDWDVSQWGDLESTVEYMRPALVVVDSFNAIHNDPGFEENSPQASQTIKKLERLSTKYGVPIVLIHHTSKNKENKGVHQLRGSTAIAASCSSVLLLGNMDGTTKTLIQPKIRGSEPLNMILEMDVEMGRFTVMEGKTADDATKSLAQRLKEFFTANQEQFFEMAEIKDQFPGEDRKVLTNALNRLVNQGHITKRPSKINPRSKVYGTDRTDDDFESSKGGHSPSSPCVKNDDLKSESIENKAMDDVTIVSPSTSPSCHHHVTINFGDNRAMTTESIENKAIESPCHHVTIESPQGGESVSVSIPPNDSVLSIEWEDLIAEIKLEMDRLQWDKDKARIEAAKLLRLEHLPKNIQALDNDQVLIFLSYIRGITNTNQQKRCNL